MKRLLLLLSGLGVGFLAGKKTAERSEPEPPRALMPGPPPGGDPQREGATDAASNGSGPTQAPARHEASDRQDEPDHDDRSDEPDEEDQWDALRVDEPTELPKRGWIELFKRTKDEVKRDNVPLLGAGVALYALLALVPTLIAVVSIYGLVSDPAEVRNQMDDLLAAAPTEVEQLITSQLEDITDNSSGGLGIAAVLSILAALWSASSGMKHLIAAINAAYDEEETRGFLKLRGLALGLTFGAIVFIVVAFSVIAVLPALLADTALGRPARVAVSIGRFPLLFLALLAGLAVLYRLAPDRDDPRWSWTAPGTIVAGVLWVIASIGFSIYTANFGKFGESFGAAGSIIVVMLWLTISATVVLIGAEMNEQAELLTTKDTTVGEPQPMGERDASAADHVVPV